MRKHISMLLIIIVVLSLSIGYSALNADLSISGEAIVRAAADIRVTDIKLDSILNNGKEIYSPEFTKDTTTMSVSLNNQNSTVTYNVTITNKTGKKIRVKDIIEENNSNSNVSYEIIGLDENGIYSGEQINFQITFTNKTNIIQEEILTLKYDLEIFDGYTVTLVQNDNVIENNIDKDENTTNFNNVVLNDNDVVIRCNNGVVPSYSNNTLNVRNVKNNSTCQFYDSLNSSINGVDKSLNNLVMLKDTTFTTNISTPESSNIKLDLNGKKIGQARIGNYGDLEVLDTAGNGQFVASGQVLSNVGDGTLTINGGYFQRTNGTGTTIYQEGTGRLVINDGTFVNSSTGGVIQNSLSTNEVGGTVEINGGIFLGNRSVIVNFKGNITITNNVNRVYISSYSQTWNPAIVNYYDNTLKINASVANKCTSNSRETTSGLCVYAEGVNDGDYSSNTNNGAVQNHDNGELIINGGSYYGAHQGINNGGLGTTYISNAYVASSYRSVLNHSAGGSIYICNSTLSLNSNNYSAHLVNTGVGYIYYSNDLKIEGVVDNLITFGNGASNIIGNYNGSCKVS